MNLHTVFRAFPGSPADYLSSAARENAIQSVSASLLLLLLLLLLLPSSSSVPPPSVLRQEPQYRGLCRYVVNIMIVQSD